MWFTLNNLRSCRLHTYIRIQSHVHGCSRIWPPTKLDQNRYSRPIAPTLKGWKIPIFQNGKPQFWTLGLRSVSKIEWHSLTILATVTWYVLRIFDCIKLWAHLARFFFKSVKRRRNLIVCFCLKRRERDRQVSASMLCSKKSVGAKIGEGNSSNEIHINLHKSIFKKNYILIMLTCMLAI